MASNTPQVLQVNRGDTWAWLFRYRAGGDPTAIIDMTGSGARMQVRDRVRGKVVAAAGCDPAQFPVQGSISMDWWLGEVRVVFPPEVTSAVNEGRYDTDLEITWGDGSTRSTRKLLVRVEDDVTSCPVSPLKTPLYSHFVRQYVTGDDLWYFTGDPAGYTIDFHERIIYMTAYDEWYLDDNRDGYMTYVPQYDAYTTSDGLIYQTYNTLDYTIRRVLP